MRVMILGKNGMTKIANDPKLVECLFGHHDFFTEGHVRQCKRCKIVQLYSYGAEWYTIKFDTDNIIKDFDLETTPKSWALVETTSPELSHIEKWLKHWTRGVTAVNENPDDIIFYTRVQV